MMDESKKNIEYLTPKDFVEIVNTIKSFEYEHAEEIPDYTNEFLGVDKYFSLIERSKQDYYPSVIHKVAHLFVNINGHYFSNGNKRLAVVSALHFLQKNNYIPTEALKDDYRQSLRQNFGDDIVLESLEEFSPLNFAMYNFAIIVAMQNRRGVSFDEIKHKVEHFFEATFRLK